MIKESELLKKAAETGFTNYKIIDTDKLQFDSSFRKFCEDNYCGNYNNNYSCPPSCGTPEELRKRTEKFERVLVLQTVTPVKNIADNSETKVIKHCHNQMTWKLIEDVSEDLEAYLPAMAGPCGICSPCKKQEGKECSHPEKKASCLSAYCVKVDALADCCKMPYWCDGEVAFFSLLFFDVWEN